ncbi:hypothetical protein G7Y79_00051g086390 [Physcia stellaris]|nr:hypothetical protein G7Y79_00051g086390 [Physcia stellaris]
MTKDGGKIVLLTGAPLSKSLDWADGSLCCPLQDCFVEREGKEPYLPPSSSAIARPVWRHLPLEVKHLPSGLTQLVHDAREESQKTEEETSFLTVTDISILSDSINESSSQDFHSSGSSDDALTQFYEHSYAIHEELPTTNVFSLDSVDDGSVFSIDESKQEHRQGHEVENLEPTVVKTKPRSLNVTSLKDIPNSSMIRRLSPSTMSVDLIIGILSISPPKLIKTKKYGRLVELVEMIVADETKSGFGITVWLPVSKANSTKAPQGGDLRSSIVNLRPQDIVLARNVALDSFRGKVYGQSLRKEVTKLDLLYRTVVDAYDQPGAYSWDELNRSTNDPQLSRVKQLNEWVMSFVGVGKRRSSDGAGKTRRSVKQGWPQLPADTQ